MSAGLLICGGLWWWAALRLVLVPGQAGTLEGTVVAGGWGLSLLPVHVTAAGTRSRAPRYDGYRAPRYDGSISGRPFLRHARRWFGRRRGVRREGRPGIGFRGRRPGR
ncbi:hypothetical protein ACWCWD_30760 [Streptomyces sp. NPDC001493]